MKLITSFFAIVCALQLCAQHSLKVEVPDIKKMKGSVQICLFDSDENYMKNAVVCEWLEVGSDRIEHTFNSLTSGNYAVVVIQDLNGNKDLDTNFIGIPKEPYGFSNNPTTTFGPPSFDGASFKVESDTEIRVELK